MTPIVTPRLILRNWERRDRELFHRINSEEAVMRFFPFRRDRAQAERFLDELHCKIEARGFGFAAMESRDTGNCIGFCGLSPTTGIPTIPDGTLEIGWRLAPEFWGRGYATEAARVWLDYGFEILGREEIVSFAVRDNERSVAVMRRIGMRPDPARDFDHPGVPESHPHLRHHVFHTIRREAWLALRKTA